MLKLVELPPLLPHREPCHRLVIVGSLTLSEPRTLSRSAAARQNANPKVNPISNPKVNPNANPNAKSKSSPNVIPDLNPIVNPDANVNANSNAKSKANPNANPDLNPNVNPDVNLNANPKANPNASQNANPDVNLNVYHNAIPIGNPNSNPSRNPHANSSAKLKANPSGNPNANPSGIPKVYPNPNLHVNPNANPKANRSGNPSANLNANPGGNPKANPNVNPSSNPKANPRTKPSANLNLLHGRIPVAAMSKPFLLVIDLNGVLFQAFYHRPSQPQEVHPSYILKRCGRRTIACRPFAREFLKWCSSSRFEVALWTTAAHHNAEALAETILGKDWRRTILDLFHQADCHKVRLPKEDEEEAKEKKEEKEVKMIGIGAGRGEKTLFLKDLAVVWKRYPCFGPQNTLLIDDSPYKAAKNSQGNCLFPPSFLAAQAGDSYLRDELIPYLRRLQCVKDIRDCMKKASILKRRRGFKLLRRRTRRWRNRPKIHVKEEIHTS